MRTLTWVNGLFNFFAILASSALLSRAFAIGDLVLSLHVLRDTAHSFRVDLGDLTQACPSHTGSSALHHQQVFQQVDDAVELHLNRIAIGLLPLRHRGSPIPSSAVPRHFGTMMFLVTL